MTLLYLGVYLAGCALALPFFLLARAPSLTTQNWFWPVIFLWPLLLLWPAYFLAAAFLKWKAGKTAK